MSGPYRAEHGAVHHEDAAGFLFTVQPASFASDVAVALNGGKARHPEPERTEEVVKEAYAYLATVKSVDGAMPEAAMLIQKLQSRVIRLARACAS